MKELAARKRLLLAEAALHRQLIQAERVRIAGRWAGARTFAGRHQGWLLAGTMGLGLLLTRRWRTVFKWLPLVLATTRAWSRSQPAART